MAGMFYSLKETAERLGKTEEEIKQLATDGQLREFRDGSNLLFKIDEVNALVAEGLDTDAAAEPEMDLDLSLEPEEGGADVAAEGEPEFEPEMDLELEPSESEPEPEPDFDLAEMSEPAETPEAEPSEAAEIADEDLPLGLDETSKGDVEMPAQADASAFDLAPDAEATDDDASTAEFSPDDLLAGTEDEQAEEPSFELGDESEISLAPETGMMSGSDITNMDTALTGEGVNILGDTGADDSLGVTDDSLAETIGPAGTSTEASLEEIEDDVNLDSFGSGSGLLDLSLQADDTSLGGILDDIYAADGGEEAAAEPGSVDDMTAEVEGAPEADLTVPEPMVAAPVAVGTTYAEAPPDTQSNMLGMLLFVPLAALLYTAIVAWAGQKGIMPSILGSVQGLIWFVIGGGIVVTLIVFGASFVVGGEKAGGATRTRKAKKEKAPKEKKAKGAKKEKAPKAKKEKAPKAAKAAKPKKEKKPFFGKKKG